MNNSNWFVGYHLGKKGHTNGFFARPVTR